MAKVSKRYAEAAKLVDSEKTYSIEEAVALAKKSSTVKFDASVEVSFRLNVDPRHADQQIRGAMVLPNGTGKTQRVCVVAQGDKEKAAKEAKEIKEQTVANAKKQAETELLQVKEEGETLKKKACEKTEQETEALKALAQGKEEEAVSAVMKALL